MTKLSPTRPEYLPAAGRDAFLPFYDLLSRLAGVGRIHRELLEGADLSPGQHVLEIGCGTGNLSSAAHRAEPGIILTAIDPDPLALRRARKKSASITFEQAFAERLPYADDSFERVLSALMLHHLDPDLKAAALAEASRVTAPGGSLHIVDFVNGGHGRAAHRMLHAGSFADNIPSTLRDAGFTDVETLGQRTTRLGAVGFWRAGR